MTDAERVLKEVTDHACREAWVIALSLGLTRREVNRILHNELRDKVYQDRAWRWWPKALQDSGTFEPLPRDAAKEPVAGAGDRRAKRSVPPLRRRQPTVPSRREVLVKKRPADGRRKRSVAPLQRRQSALQLRGAAVLVRNPFLLYCAESFVLPDFVSPHPSTPLSEAQYTGQTIEEALVRACEGPFEPDEALDMDIRSRRFGEVLMASRRLRCDLQRNRRSIRDVGRNVPWYGPPETPKQQPEGCESAALAGAATRFAPETPQQQSDAGAGGTRAARDASNDLVKALTVGWEGVEPWQVALAAWRARKAYLRSWLRRSNDRGAKDLLRAWGGMTTDYAHKYRVQEALRMGKAVPCEVLRDYPDLSLSCPEPDAR